LLGEQGEGDFAPAKTLQPGEGARLPFAKTLGYKGNMRIYFLGKTKTHTFCNKGNICPFLLRKKCIFFSWGKKPPCLQGGERGHFALAKIIHILRTFPLKKKKAKQSLGKEGQQVLGGGESLCSSPRPPRVFLT